MEITFGGGLNEQDDTQVKPEECTQGYNFELSLGNTHFKPRLPFDLKGGRNLFKYSEQVDNAVYSKDYVTISADSTTSPDGTADADSIILDSSTNYHAAYQTTVATSGSVGQNLTASVYLKAGTVTKAAVTIGGLAFSSVDYGIKINLSTGAYISDFTAGPDSYSITDIGSGWYRVSVTKAAVVSGATFLCSVFLLDSSGTISYAGDGASQLYAFGYQAEKSSSVGDYVKTTTTAVTGSVNGLIQLVKNDNTETTLVQMDTEVFKWDGDVTYTDVGTVTSGSKLRDVTWSLGGYSVITDLAKLTVVKKWDGTTFSTLTTGLGATDLYAKYVIVHLGRVWLFNVKAGTDTPHLMVASAFETPTSYDTAKRAKDSSFSTGTEAFYMVTPDLLPINGVAVFYNVLIISTVNGRLWKLTGTSSLDFAWTPFYSGSCAIGTESMANIGNDVVYMRNGGVIESLQSTMNFGDVKTDDLSRWIPDTINGLTDAITVYDQERQKVYFFAGSNKLLVLYKHMVETGLSPWSVYITDHTSSFSATCAKYMRDPGTSSYYVFWGDTNGNIYRMEGEGTGDPSSTNINTSRRTKYLYDPEISNLSGVTGRVEYKRIADCDLLMDFEWADDYSITRCTVPLEGPPIGDGATYYGGSAYYGGAFYFNTGFFYANRISTKGFSPVGEGPGLYLTTTVQATQEFDIIKIRT